MGRGSIFFADLPIYSANKDTAPPPSPGLDVPVSTILRPLDISSQCLLNDISNHSDAEKVDDEEDGVMRSTVLPFRNEEEISEVRGYRTAANARRPTRILIVDDSSMNRYVVVLPFF